MVTRLRLEDITIGEAKNRYNKHHPSSAYALIRARARQIAKQNNMTTCNMCGYSKHVEIAHIKAISSFPSTAKISEVNNIDNLKALCPNCHWEMDNLK